MPFLPAQLARYKPRGNTPEKRNMNMARILGCVNEYEYEHELIDKVQAGTLLVWTESGLSLDDFALLRFFERAIQGNPYHVGPPIDDVENGADFVTTYASKSADMLGHAIDAAKTGQAALFKLWRVWWPHTPASDFRKVLGTTEPEPLDY